MLGVPQVVVSSDMPREATSGDTVATNYRSQSLTTAGAGTLTAALIAGGVIRRTGPGAGFTDTTDTAENIRQALGSPPNGTSFELTYINGAAQAMTFAAGVGVTTVGTVNVAASAIRRYLITMLNNTPQQTYLVTNNTSTAITGMTRAQTDTLSVGMAVSGTNIAASSVIVSIQPGVGVTLNNATTGSGSNQSVTFSPVVSFEGLFAGSA